MADWKFHCDVLCVSESASPAEIKAAFRKLALRYHPDHGGSKDKFQRINNSYKYLMRNAASRPAPTPSPPPRAAPTPPPGRQRPHRSATKGLERYLRAAREQLLRGKLFFRNNRATIFAALPAATAGLTALVSLTVFFAQTRQLESSADQAAASSRDELGRARGRCEMLAFDRGDLRDKSSTSFSEWDCDLACNHWTSTHETFAAECAWNGHNFRRHAANQNTVPDRATASLAPQTLAVHRPRSLRTFTADGKVDDPDYAVEFRKGALPDNVGPEIPYSHHKMKISEELRLEAAVTPIVWIEKEKSFIAIAGVDNHHVILSAMVPGDVTVVLTDHYGQPIQTLYITVE